MTGIQGINYPAGGIIQTPPSNIGANLALMIEALTRRAQRKDEQARTAVNVGVRTPGITFGALPEDLQRSFMRATGRRNIAPDEVLLPPSNISEQMLAEFNNPNSQIFPPGSIMRDAILPTMLATAATGAPAPLMGRVGHETTASANVARAGTTADQARLSREAVANLEAGRPLTDAQTAAYRVTQGVVAGEVTQQQRVGEVGAAAAVSARGAQQATAAGTEPTAEQTLGYQAVFNVTPGEVLANQASASLRQGIMREATRVLSDPESSSLAGPLREIGISVGDGIAAAALGIMPALSEGASRRTTIINNAGQARNLILEAQLRVAGDVAKNMGGGDPMLIANVMAGDPATLRTPAGQAISAFMASGFNAAIAERAVAGDPGLRTLATMMEFARTRLGQDDETLSALGDSYRTLLRNSLARTLMPGVEPGTPAYQAGIREIDRRFGGVLRYNSRGLFRPGRLEPNTSEAPRTPTEEVNYLRSVHDAAHPDTTRGPVP